MEISRKSLEPFKAIVNCGLLRAYSEELISKDDIIKEIKAYQIQLIKEKKIFLSVSISESLIVLNNQKEPHITLNFINYPRFPMDPLVLKLEIESLVKKLMDIFNQNRVVIEYHDETVMLEYSGEIDPKIRAELDQ